MYIHYICIQSFISIWIYIKKERNMWIFFDELDRALISKLSSFYASEGHNAFLRGYFTFKLCVHFDTWLISSMTSYMKSSQKKASCSPGQWWYLTGQVPWYWQYSSKQQHWNFQVGVWNAKERNVIWTCESRVMSPNEPTFHNSSF